MRAISVARTFFVSTEKILVSEKEIKMKRIFYMVTVFIVCIVCLCACNSKTILPCFHKNQLVVDEYIAPTCTESGLTAGIHCTKCERVLIAQKTLDPLGHSNVTDAAIKPTCTNGGLSEGEHCARCGYVSVAQNALEPLGHTKVTDAAVEPTCTSTGLTEGSRCSDCKATLVAQEILPLAHDFSEWTVLSQPTCYSSGEKTRSCSLCEEVELTSVDALYHPLERDSESGIFSCDICNVKIYAGHAYRVIDESATWIEAYAACEELGGHLATITDAEEQRIITALMENAEQMIYWIGGIKTDGEWHWITGEDLSYFNWDSRQPDNAGSIEWYLNVYGKNSPFPAGSWNDLDSMKTKHAGYTSGYICEWEINVSECEHYFTEWADTVENTCYNDGEMSRFCTYCGEVEAKKLEKLEHDFIENETTGLTVCEHCNAVTFEGRIYKIFATTPSTWFEAYVYCKELGGHLATITSAEEQALLDAYLTNESCRDFVWVGGYNDNGVWHWVTDEEFDYANWYETQPDCYRGSEFFIHINFENIIGSWNDCSAYSDLTYLICEWEADN